jgi:hypothetical protein
MRMLFVEDDKAVSIEMMRTKEYFACDTTDLGNDRSMITRGGNEH